MRSATDNPSEDRSTAGATARAPSPSEDSSSAASMPRLVRRSDTSHEDKRLRHDVRTTINEDTVQIRIRSESNDLSYDDDYTTTSDRHGPNPKPIVHLYICNLFVFWI